MRDLKTNKINLYCKGADSVLLNLMDKKNCQNLLETEKNLEDYGNIGLRTLLLCEREISEQEYAEWSQKYHEACTTLIDRELNMSKV